MNSVRFVSALNCKSAETAFAAMRRTKEKFCKTGGVLGYHFIQSFAPGEVTPEQAHEIGCEFARRLFGEDFEVVVGTHLDKAHPHNHIIVNSVSRIDGHKYHSSPESYYNDVRGTSDELCRENNLSVIAPRGKGKHYAEWKAEQVGKPTVRGVIRADIDTIIQQAYTYDSFLMLLRKTAMRCAAAPIENTPRSNHPERSGQFGWTVWARVIPKQIFCGGFPGSGAAVWPRLLLSVPSIRSGAIA